MANETILVVDDSIEVIRFLTQYVLVPSGYNVLTASDGSKGLEVAVSKNPDLILLDMSMPRMSGLQMLAALRQTDVQAPVIFMTMHGSENIAVEVFRLGVRDYLTKPFTVEEVRVAVDRALREERLAKEKEALARQLASADTVRQTVITLSHYINNSLMVVEGGLNLVEEGVKKQESDFNLWQQVIHDSLDSAHKIKAVMRVLQRVTGLDDATYHGNIRMIDIEKALQEELDKTD